MAWHTTTTHAEFVAFLAKAHTQGVKVRCLETDRKRNATWYIQTNEPAMGRRGKQIIFGRKKL